MQPKNNFTAEEIVRLFKQEAGELVTLFQIFKLPISEAETSLELNVYNPGVYVFLLNNEVIKVGRSLTNSRKRALEHIRDATKNDRLDMSTLKNNPNAKLLLFNLIAKENHHWAAAFEIFFENVLNPVIKTKRMG